MKINSNALGLSFASATSIIWLVLLLLFSGFRWSGAMMHMGTTTGLHTGMMGFSSLFGLVIWFLIAYSIAGLTGVIYNRLTRSD